MLYRSRSGWAKGENPIVFNFFRSFRAVTEKFKPDLTYFVLEGRPVKRLNLMSEYKAQRVYTDHDDFNRQRNDIIRILRNRFPVKVVRHPDYECDDVLASIATTTHCDDECTVVSSDSDFYQLLQTHENLKLYNPVKKLFVETPEFDYVSWKSLRGDSTDNIPGFKGIGDKRALSLISDSSLLADFLKQEDNQALFERNEAMIRFHSLTDDELNDLEVSTPDVDWEYLRTVFTDMKFFSMTNDKSWDKFVKTFDYMT